MRLFYRLALSALITAPCFAQDSSMVTVAGVVRGASGTHTVIVAIWRDSGFLAKPVQQLRLVGHDTSFRFVVPRGSYAVSAFEDRNENGSLDMGLFGPKEPNGFWRPFHGHHKPRFNEVSNVVEHDVSDADVSLRR